MEKFPPCSGNDTELGHRLQAMRIAHISDLHLLEPGAAQRTGAARLRLEWLTFGRTRSPERVRRRALWALRAARDSDARHLIATGDLTEDGVDAQFEALAEVLAESGWAPERVTLVPGNHDAYSDPDAWRRALVGPLRSYAATSTGRVLDLGGALLVPISTAMHQPLTRAAGKIAPADLDRVGRVAEDAWSAARPVIVAMHHQPFRKWTPLLQWIDGLADHARVTALLERHDHLSVLHGHTHAALDQPVRAGGFSRVFSADATVACRTPVRTYRLAHGRLFSEEPLAARLFPAVATAW